MKSKTFSIEGYDSIIELAKKRNYILTPARHALEYKKRNSRPILILRHDVDMDIEEALKLAEFEFKKSITSTYFILLYNNFYNPFSPENREIIKKIKAFGHEIGLHWDSRNYNSGCSSFKRDLNFLSEVVGEKIVSGSQHEPTQTPLMKGPDLLKYEAYRDFKDFIYVSDSSMRWRQHTPWELIQKQEDVQFLAHPLWWIIMGKTRKQKFINFALSLKNKNQRWVDKCYKNLVQFLPAREQKDKYFGYKNKKLK